MKVLMASGPGTRLPTAVLLVAGISTLVAVLVSVMSIGLQFKNYRKPMLQRMVVRIMIMVPIYAISSLISLFSVEAAFVIDAIRDIYEAFVIYCFFVLLLSYLGGERSLLILLHGRPPKAPVFPLNLFKREIDVSDPYTFLFLKRGILQYVQVKPILAAVTLILKACGKYNEGDFRANSGYLYVSIVYNTSICLSLYCLAMFWMCVSDDLKPFRPVPKFLCVKGILFFSFWQSIGISILVAARVITKLGPYTDPENVSVGLTDTLICIEMPFFAIAHMFAFSYTDFIDPHCQYVARMPFLYALRDSFGLLDVIEDSKATLRGEGMDYREFEPSEGLMHQGDGRDRRIRAGLRYAKGGKQKYWLPRPAKDNLPPGPLERRVNRVITRFAGEDQAETLQAPLLSQQAEDVIHIAPDLQGPEDEANIWGNADVEDGYDLPFGDIDDMDEELFAHSKRYLFGDYNYPTIDVSSETARSMIWDEEERVLHHERGAWFSPLRGSKGQAALEQRKGPVWQGYGAIGSTIPRKQAQTDYLDDGNTPVADNQRGRSGPSLPADVPKKAAKGRPGSQSGLSSISQSRQRPSLPSSSSSGNAATPSRLIRSPIISRNNSQKHGSPPVLPPDAIDLVVEDSQAAQDEHVRERRKGEPAVRGSALRKVYRRGFVTQDEEGHKVEGEVEAEGDEGARLILDAIDDSGETPHTDQIIARAVTPPIHARTISPRYDDIEDDNPWA